MDPSSHVTERDLRILAFVAEHRIVVSAHVQALIGVGESVAYGRLRALTKRGLLDYDRLLHGRPGWYQITRRGLAIIDSELPAPRLDLHCYRHDIGAAWTWLAASRGAFGRVERIVSEREMRSRDGVSAAAGGARGERAPDAGEEREPPYGVHLGGVGARGQIRLHYPDLLLIGPGGERVAVELELSAKGGRRLETILAGYGADPSISAVLYLAEKPAIQRGVRAAAARLGISDRVHVHPLAWAPRADPDAKRPPRTRSRGRAQNSPRTQDSHRAQNSPRTQDAHRAQDARRAQDSRRELAR
jgi:hypothetical protein